LGPAGVPTPKPIQVKKGRRKGLAKKFAQNLSKKRAVGGNGYKIGGKNYFSGTQRFKDTRL